MKAGVAEKVLRDFVGQGNEDFENAVPEPRVLVKVGYVVCKVVAHEISTSMFGIVDRKFGPFATKTLRESKPIEVARRAPKRFQSADVARESWRCRPL